MTEVCHDVCIELTLQPLTGEVLSNATSISDDGTRLDIGQMDFGVDVPREPSLM